jgi:hypothetical protein
MTTDFDFGPVREQLDAQGFALTPPLLSPGECAELAGRFDDGRFRTTVEMARHRFGAGRYRYFDHPLPELIGGLRAALYPPLAAVANDWAARLGEAPPFPPDLETFLARCHAAGQHRPTPLILRYGPGGHNTLHQDVYGEVVFPLQALTVLDRPGEDFTGGEFVLVEQRPRAQSRAHVVALRQGAFLLFPTRHRPVTGARGAYRATMRHGVSTVHSGRRTTLGIIFHDAA